eukprot:2621753-Prymnesium_polylepis.1
MPTSRARLADGTSLRIRPPGSVPVRPICQLKPVSRTALPVESKSWLPRTVSRSVEAEEAERGEAATTGAEAAAAAGEEA